MILYFSATGNCKYVASRLAESAEQDMLSIVDCIRENRYSFEDNTIRMVFPHLLLGSAEYRGGIPAKGRIQSGVSLLCFHLWNNTRRLRCSRREGNQREKDWRILLRTDAGHMDADVRSVNAWKGRGIYKDDRKEHWRNLPKGRWASYKLPYVPANSCFYHKDDFGTNLS